jgi:hypothetical protein
MLSNEELILTCDTGLFSERNTNYVFPCTLSRVRGFVYHQIKTILNHINVPTSDYPLGIFKLFLDRFVVWRLHRWWNAHLECADRRFEPWSCHSKDFKFGNCCFTAKHSKLRSNVVFRLYFVRLDGDVCFVLDKHTFLEFDGFSSLNQHYTDPSKTFVALTS